MTATVVDEQILFYTTKGPYGFLSNFHRASQECPMWNGVEHIYSTNENFYQSRKATEHYVELWIAKAPHPFLAMKAGQSLRIGKEFRDDWESIRVSVMLEGLRAKFSQNMDLKDKLLATGESPIHEASPHDLYWGYKGQDMLGKLLVQVRKELRG